MKTLLLSLLILRRKAMWGQIGHPQPKKWRSLGTESVDTLILDFQPPEPWEISFYCVEATQSVILFLFNIILNGLKQSLLDHVSVWFYDQITFRCMGAIFCLSIHQLMGIWVISTSWLSWIMLLSRRVDSHWQWGAATAATDQPALALVPRSWGPGFLSTPSSSSSGACLQSFGSPSASLSPCWGRMTELQLVLL